MSSAVEVVIAVAALLVAIAGAYFAYRTIQQRAKLAISMTETPLLTNRDDVTQVGERITIQHAEFGPLTYPNMVRVTIGNSGRVDIGSSHFDAQRPLQLDLGTAILEPLETLNNRPSQSPPPMATQATSLLIGPGLISCGQSLTFTCLVDGHAKLQVTHSLREVDIEGRPSVGEIAIARHDARRRLMAVLAATMVGSAVLTLVLPPLLVLSGMVGSAFYAIVGSLIKTRTARTRARKALGL